MQADERLLGRLDEVNDAELADVSGGVAETDFSRIVEDFARANRCATCSRKEIYRKHAMCLEVYDELLKDYCSKSPVRTRCTHRQ